MADSVGMERPQNAQAAAIGTREPITDALLPVDVTQAAIIRTFGVDNIIALLAGGSTVSDIAEVLGVSAGMVALEMHNMAARDTNTAAKLKAARRVSAEVIMDQAGAILDAPQPTIPGGDGSQVPVPLSSAQVALRQARANHKRFIAGVRDGRYREKAPEPEERAAAAAPAINIVLNIAATPPDIARIIDGAGVKVDD